MHSPLEAGPLVRAAVDTGASVASQVASNALDGKPLGDGVGMAALSGAAASIGLGAVVEAGGSGVARLLGRGVEDAEGETATVAPDVEGDVATGDACGLSFAADTRVTLADGSGTRAIASLHAGDTVLAYDPTTGKAGSQPVERVFINHDANLVDVTLVSDGTSRAPGTSVASDGKARDVAVAAHGTRAPPAHGEAVRHAELPSETIHTTTNHPWLTAAHGWLPAGFLHLGERVVRADGTMATVVAVRAAAGAAAMYDLTVGAVHTFAVGDGRYVVHNCDNPADTLAKYRKDLDAGNKRTVAYADYSIGDEEGRVAAVSGDARRAGAVDAPSQRLFSPPGTGANKRMFDAELNILEHIGGKFSGDAEVEGTIDMFVDNTPCTSCRDVFGQFRDRFPNIRLNVTPVL